MSEFSSISCAGCEINVTSTTISSHTVKPKDNFAESVRQLGDPESFEQWQDKNPLKLGNVRSLISPYQWKNKQTNVLNIC